MSDTSRKFVKTRSVDKSVDTPQLPSQPGWLARKVKQPWSRRALVKTIDSLISSAKDHEANALPAGHDHYKTLLAKAESAVSEYARTWGISESELYSQLGSLEVLRKLSTSAAARSSVFALAALPLVVLAPMVLGATIGLFAVGYHWITTLLGA